MWHEPATCAVTLALGLSMETQLIGRGILFGLSALFGSAALLTLVVAYRVGDFAAWLRGHTRAVLPISTRRRSSVCRLIWVRRALLSNSVSPAAPSTGCSGSPRDRLMR